MPTETADRCILTTDLAARAEASRLVQAVRPHFPRGVAAPALRALSNAGYRTLDSVAGAREADLRAMHGMGPGALRILREALAARGEAFRP